MSAFFIAEISSNHGRDLSRSKALIDAAAQAGCDAVKFQLFRIERMFAPEILAQSAKHRARTAWELPLSFLPDLAAHCQERGIQFSCTPFYVEAVGELQPFVSFYKIASYELLYDPLLVAAARTGKPVIVSTGMASIDEIRHANLVLERAGARDVTFLHCVSAYPAPPEQANLAAIETLRQLTGRLAGWSDHTVSPAVILRAVERWQAAAIEFHLDLDGAGAEFAPGHCWLPHQIGEVIQLVREGERADGTGIKEPVAAELPDREWRADPEDGMRPMRAIRASYKPDAA
ncbi:MAG: N-acetylneuraminate synthase family protein [Alphaproteobacteria bacterium]|nr:N-acetylneuraminate synthase family protein [Alphaproteobacteria bacterium]